MILTLVIASLVGLLDTEFEWGSLVLVVAAGGGGCFFGPRLGSLIIVLSTAAASAYLVISGLSILYIDEFQTDLEDPGATIAKSLPFVTFLVMAAIGGPGQYVNSRLRLQRRN